MPIDVQMTRPNRIVCETLLKHVTLADMDRLRDLMQEVMPGCGWEAVYRRGFSAAAFSA
jgi:hypothetical protein